jgi:UDP-3-O-[3-hydroxymyristoyl] glucosamine N-acyltransferase 3
MTVEELCKALGLELAGDGTWEILRVGFADVADEYTLAIVRSERELLATRAHVVLSEPRIAITDKTILYCSYGELTEMWVRAVRLLVEVGLYPDYDRPPVQTMQGGGWMCGTGTTIGTGTEIAPFVSIGDSVVIGANCRIAPNVVIGSGTVMGDRVVLQAGVKVGVPALWHYEENGRPMIFSGVGRCILGNDVQVGCNTVIQRGTLLDTFIGDGTVIGNLVELAHDVKVGENSLILSQTGICGGAEVGQGVRIMGQVGINERVCVAAHATVLARSMVTKHVGEKQIVSGAFSREHRKELRLQARIRRLLKEE